MRAEVKLKQAHILIKGDKIQKVGFRDYLRDIAVKYRLVGEVHNVRNYDRDVMVICEGDLKSIKAFIKEIEALKETPKGKKKPTMTKAEELLISVDKVAPTFHDSKGVYNDFTVIRPSDELNERIYDGFQQLRALRIESKENFDKLDEKYGEFSEILAKMPKEIAKELKRIK